MTATNAPGYDPRHWATTDGHHHVSIAAPAPTEWKPRRAEDGSLTYVSGTYSIRRIYRGYSQSTYIVFRDGVELILAFYPRLRDAKERAVKNAEGRDVVNVA